MREARKLILTLAMMTVSAVSFGQIPDLLNALDAGGRAMGMGGSIYAAGSDTQSSLNNPAGLAFAEAQASVIFRNLPESLSQLTGEFRNPVVTTRPTAGRRTITHAGINMPLGRGAWGLAYTTQGYIRDLRGGTNLTDAGVEVRDYAELLKIKTDYLSFGYGQSGANGFSWGISALVAFNSVRDRLTYRLFSGGTEIGGVNTDSEQTAVGVGGVVGFQYSPKGNSNVSVGGSIRTPISVNHDAATKPYATRLPGKASLGLATMRDGIRGGRDYIVLGFQGDFYFGEGSPALLPRKEQFVLGAGLEYNYHFGTTRVPIRIGFNTVQGGGSQFSDRNAFSLGFGYRPEGGRYGIDLDFASPSRGGKWDMSLGVNFKLKQ